MAICSAHVVYAGVTGASLIAAVIFIGARLEDDYIGNWVTHCHTSIVKQNMSDAHINTHTNTKSHTNSCRNVFI